MAESAGILLKITADSKQAVQSVEQFRKEVKQLEKEAREALTPFQEWGRTMGLTAAETEKFGGQLKTVGLVAGAAAAGIAVAVGAAITVTKQLFDASKAAAEFGSTIFDASQKTGLGAERLSAMKFAADQAGTSLEVITAGTARFSKVIIDAANGSEKAEAKLKRLGVTSTDLDTALKQALATIVKVPAGTQQMALAMDAFGKSGADLLPFIKSFDGDLDALTEKAKKLGVTMTDEAARAADEFGDQLDTLNAQFEGITRTIGIAFMPIFNDMARAVSEFLTRNQNEIRAWATSSVNFIKGFADIIDTTSNSIQQLADGTHYLSGAMTGLLGTFIRTDPILRGIVYLYEKWANALGLIVARGSQLGGIAGEIGGQISPAIGAPAIPSGGGPRGGGRAPRAPRADNSEQRKEEQREARDRSAQLQLELRTLSQEEKNLGIFLDNLLKKAAEMGTGMKDFRQQTAKMVEANVVYFHDLLSQIEATERANLKADATDNERALLKAKQEDRRAKFKEDFAARLEKLDKDHFDLVMQKLDDEYKANEHLLEIEEERRKRREADMNLGTIPGLSPIPGDIQPETGSLTFFDSVLLSWDNLVEAIISQAPGLMGVADSLASSFQNAFNGMAQAIGNVVQQWVLYGNTGPAIMRKILASALATIAAEAAVRAIYELAAGFACLFLRPDEAAGHFVAAALFGGVAAAAGLAGRAVAGNSFQQQAGQATGTTGANSQGSRPTPGAYSGEKDGTIEMGINQASSAGALTIKFEEKTGILGQLFAMEIERNGPLRKLIIDTANA